jgi:hypothetical protein
VPELPAWVYEYEVLQAEFMNYPHGRRLEPNRANYMRPLAPVGGPFEIQARSGFNNGRDTVWVVIALDGSLSVTRRP